MVVVGVRRPFARFFGRFRRFECRGEKLERPGLLDPAAFRRGLEDLDQLGRARPAPRASQEWCEAVAERDEWADRVRLPEVDDDDVGVGFFGELAIEGGVAGPA